MTATAWRARRAISLGLVLAASLLPVTVGPASAVSVTLVSGTGVAGGTDARVEASTDGEDWYPADLPAPDAAWEAIPGTGWVHRASAPVSSVVFYRVSFQLPAEFSNPQITVSVHADDAAMVFLNGSFLGAQLQVAQPANHQGPPETFTGTSGFMPGTNMLWFRVENDAGPHGIDFSATLSYGANQPPTADAGGDYVVGEGGSVALAGSGSDPDLDALTFAWDLDGDWTFETPGATPTFAAAALDGPTARPVRLQVCDPHAACTIDVATVTVTNVAPTATLVVPATALDGTLALALAGAADPGAADTAAGFTYSFDCGAGAGASPFGPASATTCPSGPLGPRTIGAAIRDRDGGTTAYTALTVVYGSTGNGSFTIGDGSTSGTVAFWGSQWAKRNSLSGGGAPAAFRGYASVPGGACGIDWSSPTGAAAGAPETVPAYIAVIVTSSAWKDVAGIFGTTVGMVVVRTDPGYQPKPGSAGTGTVIATIC